MLKWPVKPMLLDVAEAPFDSENHIFEWKIDGVRCIMHYSGGQVRLQSKTGRDCTEAFPELHKPLLSADECILDGEITVLTDGRPDFEATMGRYLAGSRAAKAQAAKKPAYYIVWDILWLDGQNLTGLPLLERKAMLDRVLKNGQHITKIDWVDGQGVALWKAIKANGLEGIVAKKKNSRYEHRRSGAWLKVKNYQEVVANVLGYKPHDGYILVGTGDKVQGHAIGIGKTDRAALWEILSRYGTEDGPTIWLPPGG